MERKDEQRAAYQRARNDLYRAIGSFQGLGPAEQRPAEQRQLLGKTILLMALRDGLNG